MADFFDKKTGFFIGSTDLIKFDEIQKKDKFNEQLSKMILSASGWRKVFAISENEEDATPLIGYENQVLAALASDAFSAYIKDVTKKENPTIVLGMDARPTGTEIAQIMIRVFLANNLNIQYVFITAAPEIMAYSRSFDGFVYISASHNPIGHNGIKFGLNDGGVIPGEESAKLVGAFKSLCAKDDVFSYANSLINKAPLDKVQEVLGKSENYKDLAVKAYKDFTKLVTSGESDSKKQDAFFDLLRKSNKEKELSIVVDMNGSARTLSIDNDFLTECGFGFSAINGKPREIVHTIIPEPENLVHCAKQMQSLHDKGQNQYVLGYMPDCDGDRGNIVYWNDEKNSPDILKAQEVFALSVLSELVYCAYKNKAYSLDECKKLKLAVSVNDPTSMRIEAIASCFGARVARAEVGEANVVNLARKLRKDGYIVPILGEGSNGGNITHPAAVRDPINTLFALIKLLTIKDSGSENLGLFHLWCKLSGQENLYKENFSLSDIIKTLPVYTTTGVSEKRAILHIQTKEHSVLKSAYQSIFDLQWQNVSAAFFLKYSIFSFEVISNNGINETHNVTDFSVSGKGGLKVLFKNAGNEPVAFVWMRGSGTEPVFRVLCDVKGDNPEMEKDLLEWHSKMIESADSIA